MAKATKKAEVKVEEVQTPIEVQFESTNEDTGIVLISDEHSGQYKEATSTELTIEPTPEEIQPVTLTGKTVPLSATGKVRLLNTNTNRIITGLIPQKLAQDQVNQFPHIKIVNEAEYVKNNNK